MWRRTATAIAWYRSAGARSSSGPDRTRCEISREAASVGGLSAFAPAVICKCPCSLKAAFAEPPQALRSQIREAGRSFRRRASSPYRTIRAVKQLPNSHPPGLQTGDQVFPAVEEGRSAPPPADAFVIDDEVGICKFVAMARGDGPERASAAQALSASTTWSRSSARRWMRAAEPSRPRRRPGSAVTCPLHRAQ